ncbi:carboxypeptidase-like regulatory domain-containing protein [bacterium]|nr:carboxypeptidase-like regulatory domain-containing protein [bacterium]
MLRWMYLLLIFCLPAFAESELSGKVLDRHHNRPLPGANVRLENSYRGAVTDR